MQQTARTTPRSCGDSSKERSRAMREGKSAGRRAVRLKPATAACAALGVLALGAAGCGSSTPASSGSSKTVTLNFWSAYNETDGESAAMAHVVIPQFEKE